MPHLLRALLSLEALQRLVSHWGDLIVFLTERKLNAETMRSWGVKSEDSSIPPTYETLKAFMKTKISSLNNLEHSRSAFPSQYHQRLKRKEGNRHPWTFKCSDNAGTFHVTGGHGSSFPLADLVANLKLPAKVLLILQSSQDLFRLCCHVEALVVPKVSSYKPNSKINHWSHLRELELGWVHARIVEGRIINGRSKEPIVMNTALDWIISGETRPDIKCDINQSRNNGDRFWEQEEVSSKSISLTPDDQTCEDHFLATHSRNEEGRYVVRFLVIS
ncbi:hypothetical protein J437_LFUL014996 [Ladona fulva]|uniref:Uncharacterized protein n=1 Tax=Ladona fulva TaxID=123851 RepID=A0A8K0KPH9_LADFU|nr:hypothetical protein J437_LFUL014996 [Ladona fulva]